MSYLTRLATHMRPDSMSSHMSGGSMDQLKVRAWTANKKLRYQPLTIVSIAKVFPTIAKFSQPKYRPDDVLWQWGTISPARYLPCHWAKHCTDSTSHRWRIVLRYTAPRTPKINEVSNHHGSQGAHLSWSSASASQSSDSQGHHQQSDL